VANAASGLQVPRGVILPGRATRHAHGELRKRPDQRAAALLGQLMEACADGASVVETAGCLRQHIDLDTMIAELLAVTEDTMQPSQVSLWLRPPQAHRQERPPPGSKGA
jgi:hypothetical protein